MNSDELCGAQEEIICDLCDSGEMEDEFTRYSQQRDNFFGQMPTHIPGLGRF